MLVRRIVPCLDIKEGRVVKGVRFVELMDAAIRSNWRAGTRTKAPTNSCSWISPRRLKAARRPERGARRGAELTIPFAVGGGVKTVEDMNDLLRAGCDKVSVNSAALRNPDLIDEAARRFGAQCVVVAIDVRTVDGRFEVVVDGGRTPTGRDAIEWAREAERRGAGELLVTSIDRDGTRRASICRCCARCAKPSTCRSLRRAGRRVGRFRRCVRTGGSDAALAASLFHYGELAIVDVKRELAAHDIPVRLETVAV